MSVIATERFTTLGTTAVVCTTLEHELGRAVALAAELTGELDAAASRFRDDSELVRLGQRPGESVQLSELLWEVLDQAIWAAEFTDGLVDPTVGGAMGVLGYSSTFAEINRDDPRPVVRVGRVPGFTKIHRDAATRSVVVPEGITIDLGATAKAACADRIVARAAADLEGGILVSLGGDIAVGGAGPADGWLVGLAARHDEPLEVGGPAVSLHHGGLASSGTAARRWRRGGEDLHHLLNPATGLPADVVWETATVAGPSCLVANAASTASIIMGEAAPAWLGAKSLPARLQRPDGTVTTVAGFPEDAS